MRIVLTRVRIALTRVRIVYLHMCMMPVCRCVFLIIVFTPGGARSLAGILRPTRIAERTSVASLLDRGVVVT